MEGLIKKNVLEKYPDNLFGESFNDEHLGGCNIYGDPGSECPKMWKYIIDKYKIKSVRDIGCGFGFHLKYFKDILKMESSGIEGSQKVIECSFFPDIITTNDYSNGTSNLESVDLIWSVEFLEHVESRYVSNFMKDFKKGNYVIVTHSHPGQSGHHHVNCQHPDYWITIFKEYGLEYDPEETTIIKNLAKEDFDDYLNWCKDSNENKPFRTFACNESESNAIRTLNSYPHVPETVLFFKKNKNN